MGTFCKIHAQSVKSFSKKHIAPSRVASNNAAVNTREEEKTVTAAEVAAPVIVISGAPD